MPVEAPPAKRITGDVTNWPTLLALRGTVVDFMTEYALAVPADCNSRDVTEAIIDARGKEITRAHANSVKNAFGVTPLGIAGAMQPDEICEDVRELIEQIANLCTVAAAEAADTAA